MGPLSAFPSGNYLLRLAVDGLRIRDSLAVSVITSFDEHPLQGLSPPNNLQNPPPLNYQNDTRDSPPKLGRSSVAHSDARGAANFPFTLDAVRERICGIIQVETRTS